VTITEKTHYPFDTTVRFRVSLERSAAFPVYLRIPFWCTGAVVRINGKDAHTFAGSVRYARVEKTWVDGDEVELVLPMSVRVKMWEQNKGSVSVSYGPLSFSLKIKENYVQVDSKASAIGDSKWQANADPLKWPAFEILPGSAWNYGLEVGPAIAGTSVASVASMASVASAASAAPAASAASAGKGGLEVIRKPWPAEDFPWTPEAAPIAIRVKGRQIPQWTVDQYGLCGILPQSPVEAGTPEQVLELIPMGAARLRISSFPVVGQ
jgi:hypothetical protein